MQKNCQENMRYILLHQHYAHEFRKAKFHASLVLPKRVIFPTH